ncbi:MAG: hypothetical protein PHF92_07520 [Bacteroidales bacterium]|nr:hypothetical protein [Bacteroidales bacterium]
MLKRLLVLITVSMLLLTYVPESSSANGKDSVFLEGSLLYNLELFEVYCPYELLACDDYLYLFDSDRSCYKLDKQNREILEVFTLSGCSHMPVNLDEEKVYALIKENLAILQYTIKNGQSQHTCLPKDFTYKGFALYDQDLFLVADDSEYLYRLINKEGEVVRNGNLRTEITDNTVSCMEYNAANEVLVIVSPRRIDIIETGSALLKTRIPLKHCLDVRICDDSIYALCPVTSENTKDQPHHSCIRVFDLEGNALKTYILDTTIRRFCFSEKEGVLYGLTLEEELPIVKFEL